ncbi:MAG: S41 family peptidase [Spirochaetes bacterium]|nr:S41 family peptidase [Spirochaetota bacterium]
MTGNRKLPGRDGIAWIALAAVLLVFSTALAFAQDDGNDKYFSTLRSVFDFVLNNYVDEVDPSVLYDGAMKGMLDSLGDPYSTYMDEAMTSDLNDTTTGNFGGLGLFIQKANPDTIKPGESPYVEVVSPIEDTPGAKAGIRPGDYISEIDGESTAPLTMDAVLKKLRGVPGTTVTITILRGESITFKSTITRAMIEVPTIKRAMLPDGTAYLRIIEFTPQTPTRIREAIDWFKTQNYKAMVIDLRNNPGGLLASVISIADLFLTDGVIVSTKSRIVYENAVYKAKPDLSVPRNVPIVILINRGSASASEILAGALKDQKRAYLVGERSYGKGAVQQIMPLGEGDTAFKLTMSRYYTPSDANIDKKGIFPDLEVAEPALSPEGEKALTKLLEDRPIETWAKANPEASDKEREAFVRGLISGGVALDGRILRKLLRNEYEKATGAPVFDLEYDLQLQEAMKLIASGELPVLVAQTRTVRETQEATAKK